MGCQLPAGRLPAGRETPPGPGRAQDGPPPLPGLGGGRLDPGPAVGVGSPGGSQSRWGRIALFAKRSNRVHQQQAERTSAAGRRHPMLQLQINNRPVVDSNLLIGIRNALQIKAGVAALIALLYWRF